MKTSTEYVFVIDTDSYSGNFERQLCGYITGVVGDCEVGEKESNCFTKEVDPDSDALFDHVTQKADEHCCYRPCSIWITPNRFTIGKFTYSSTKEANMIYPVYESVAIFFEEKPPEAAIELMKSRTEKFIKDVMNYNDKPYFNRVVRYRLIEIVKACTETETIV